MRNGNEFGVEGQIVDLVAGKIFPGCVKVEQGKISGVEPRASAPAQVILPGFIDAHVHVESSMLIPSEFARLAVTHGSVASVSDPHEIGNVLGAEGVRFMLKNGAKVPFKFYFGAPSCVPATVFETAGAAIGVSEVEELLALPEIVYLSEMMNFPGVLNGDKQVLAKIQAAQRAGKVIDGHAPGLRGAAAQQYIAAGISTDHECFTAEEARDKLKHGMKIAIREGSAAKNFEALIDLLPAYPGMIMFCTDDKHPNELARGHIDEHVRRAIARGINPLLVLEAACRTPKLHYGMAVGQLQPGDPADFIVVSDLHALQVLETYIDGEKVAERGRTLIASVAETALNRFECSPVTPEELRVTAGATHCRAIKILDGQLITETEVCPVQVEGGDAVSSPERDLLKLAVVNRYQPAPPAIAFVRGFGLRRGALASSVAHDSHNIVAVGCTDAELASSINAVIEARGGVSLVEGSEIEVLPLPVAGLMSARDGYEVAAAYDALDAKSKELGSPLAAPYMTLSFLALLVIPQLKLSDKGLFDGEKFEFTPLFISP